MPRRKKKKKPWEGLRGEDTRPIAFLVTLDSGEAEGEAKGEVEGGRALDGRNLGGTLLRGDRFTALRPPGRSDTEPPEAISLEVLEILAYGKARKLLSHGMSARLIVGGAEGPIPAGATLFASDINSK